MKIRLEFDAGRIARSFAKAFPRSSPEEIAALLALPRFQHALAEDLLSIWETTNEAEPELIAEGFPEFFVPSHARQN
jgi:hypothetical protein